MLRSGSIAQVEINLVIVIINFVIIHVSISAVLILIVMVIGLCIGRIHRGRRSRGRLVWHGREFRSGLGRFVIVVAALD